MTKKISVNLARHLAQETTTITRCWKIVRTDGVVFTFTANDADIVLPVSFTENVYGLGTARSFTGADQLLPINLYKLADSHSPVDLGTPITTITHSFIKAYNPADIDSTWTKFADVKTFLLDPTDGNVIFFVASADTGLTHLQYVLKVNTTTGSIVWKTPYESSPGSSDTLPGYLEYGSDHTKIANSTFMFVGVSNRLYTLDTSSGSLASSNPSGVLTAGFQTWDGALGRLLFYGTNASSGISNSWWMYVAKTNSFIPIIFDLSVITAPDSVNCVVDSVNSLAYFITNGDHTSTTAGLHIVDLVTGVETMSVSWLDIGMTGNPVVSNGAHLSADGHLWLWLGLSNYGPWSKIDLHTLRQVAVVGVADGHHPDVPDPDGEYGATAIPDSVASFGIADQSYSMIAGGIFASLNINDETNDRAISYDTYTDNRLRLCGGTQVVTQTYRASAGFTNSAIENKSDLSVDNQDIQGIFDDESITLQDLRAGAFDYADIYIFFINWQRPDQGILKMRRGKLGEVTSSPQGWFTVELRGMTQLLQQQIVELFGPECRADLFDSRCALLLANYQCTGHVVATLNTTQITIALDTLAPFYTANDGWFQYGALSFTSGQNNLKTLEIKAWNHTTNTVTFYVPAGYPVQVGDTFAIVPGCDKSHSTCKTKFNNVLNFRGEPFLPGNDAAFIYPDLGSG